MRIKLEQVQMNFILIEVCRLHEVRKSEILGTSRLRKLADARKYFCYYVKAINKDISLVDIGKFINRDHSTMCHALDTLNGWMDLDKNLEMVINKLLQTIELRVRNKMEKFVAQLDAEIKLCEQVQINKFNLNKTNFAA